MQIRSLYLKTNFKSNVMKFERFSCVVYNRKMVETKVDCPMDRFRFQPYKTDSDIITIHLILDDYVQQTRTLISSNFKIDISALHEDFCGVVAEVMYKFCLEEINRIELKRNLIFQCYPDKLDIYNTLKKYNFRGFY